MGMWGVHGFAYYAMHRTIISFVIARNCLNHHAPAAGAESTGLSQKLSTWLKLVTGLVDAEKSHL